MRSAKIKWVFLIFILLHLFPIFAGEKDTAYVKELLQRSKTLLFKTSFDSAQACVEEAEQICAEKNYLSLLAKSRVIKGIIFQRRGFFKNAANFYLKALTYYEGIRDTQLISLCYNNLASLNFEGGDFKSALLYFYKGLPLKLKINDFGGLSALYANMANIYKEEDKYDSALYFARKSYEYGKIAPGYIGKRYAAYMLGCIYRDDANYGEAEKYLNEALHSGDEEIREDEEINIQIALGRLYFKQGKTDEAIASYKKAELSLKNTDSKLAQENCYYGLYDCYKKKGMLNLALQYREMHDDVKDTLFSIENKRNLADVQANYETEKKEKEIALLQTRVQLQETRADKQNSQQRLMVVLIIALLLVISLVVVSLAISRKNGLRLRDLNTKLTTQNNKIELQNKEILDSIHYAKRIQQSLLATEVYIERTINRLKSKR